MSYFDHIKCHSCGAHFDPEQLVGGRGQAPACPSCSAELNLTDLFGIKDSFIGIDEERGNAHSLDDLVGGELYDARYPDGRPPSQPAPRQAHARPAGSSGSASRSGTPSLRQLTGPNPNRVNSARATEHALVPSGPGEDDDAFEPEGGPSAADLLREMKRKR